MSHVYLRLANWVINLWILKVNKIKEDQKWWNPLD